MSEGDSIEVFFMRDESGKHSEGLIKKTALEVLHGENKSLNSLSIILSDDEKLRQLNRDSLGIDEPTDVLAYDLSEDSKDEIEGEIYISLDRVDIQAAEYSIEPETELLRLLVHGILHLCGVDHDDDVSLKEMIDHGEKYVSRVY